MDARNLPKTVKVALMTKYKVARSPNWLLGWNKDKPGLHTQHWRVLDRLLETKDQDSFKIIKETGYKTFTGLTQGPIKVLSDHEPRSKHEEGTLMSQATPGSAAEEEVATMATSSKTQVTERNRGTGTVGGLPPTAKPASLHHRASLEGSKTA
jgi:hypothetical protein